MRSELGTSPLGAGAKGAEELGWQGLLSTLLGGNSVPGFEGGCAEAPGRVQLQRSALHFDYLPLLFLLGIKIVII